jgi:hypothetical protein
MSLISLSLISLCEGEEVNSQYAGKKKSVQPSFNERKMSSSLPWLSLLDNVMCVGEDEEKRVKGGR